MRHVGQALGEHAPERFMLLAFRINHPGAQQLFEAVRHFGRGPFRTAFRAGPSGGGGRGRQRTLFAGHIPEQAEKSRPARDKRLAFLPAFLLGQALFHGFSGKDLKIRRLETKMAFAGQQRATVSGHLVRVRIADKELGEPLGLGRRHFALGQFPGVHDRHRGGQFLPGLFVCFQQAHRLFPARVGRVQRPEPGQQARRRQPRFPPIRQQKAQAAPGFFSDHGDLDGIALHIFHNAARRGIAHTTRHKRSFSPNILMAARRRESSIFAVLASPGR